MRGMAACTAVTMVLAAARTHASLGRFRRMRVTSCSWPSNVTLLLVKCACCGCHENAFSKEGIAYILLLRVSSVTTFGVHHTLTE
jgi:hypothetical protein